MNNAGSSTSAEHARYLVQAEWTAELRTRILSRINLSSDVQLLEVGSGTGVITSSVAAELPGAQTFGVDLDHRMSAFAAANDRESQYVTADGHELPFARNSFDAGFTHFLHLWVREPEVVIREMQRAVRPGGWLIAFAEPDYGGRIDYPSELENIGRLQTKALIDAGADPRTGRKLRALFSDAGLTSVVAGVLGGEWHAEMDKQLTRSEWQTLKSDLRGTISAEELQQLEDVDNEAWLNQERVLFVPTFYAYGQVG